MATTDLTKIGTTTQVSNFLPTSTYTPPVPTSITSQNTKASQPVNLAKPADNTNYAGILASAQQQALAIQQQIKDYDLQQIADRNPEEADRIMDGLGYTGNSNSRTQTPSIMDYIKSIEAPPSQTAQFNEAYSQSGLDKQQADINAKSQVQREAEARLNNVSAQLQALNAEATAIPIQMQQDSEGRGRTAAGIAPLQADQLRANALKALPLQAQAAVLQAEVQNAQGNTKAAEDLYKQASDRFDRLFQLQIQDAQNQYEYKTNLINQVYAFADKQEQRQLQEIRDQADRDFTLQRDELAYQRELQMFDLEQKAKVGSGSDKLDTQVVDLNGKKVLINSQTGEVISDFGGTSGTGVLQLNQVKANVDQVDNILSSGALSGAVGPNALARFSPISSLTGSKANLIADVEQIRSQLSLQSLINSKAQGATFGALSEGELLLLQSSGSKLTQWAVEDPNTKKIVGYKASEKDFKAEMDKINNFAKLDYILKGGNPEDVGAVQQSDGKYLVKNSDGTYTTLN